MPGYLTRQTEVAIHGVASLQIRSLLDRQQFADPLGEAEALGISSAAWPLFGLLWASSLHLAAAMAVRPQVADERILELGCGLGLASLVAHRRGADITASDCHPLAGAFLAENLRLNGLGPLPYRHGHWGAPALSASSALCAPGQTPAAPAPAPPPARPPAPPPARPAVEGQFSLIIASDVLYERDARGTLCAFIQQHAAPAAEVWIVDPNRGNRAAFERRMADAGFSARHDLLSGEPGQRPLSARGPGYRGRLTRFARHAADSA